MLKEGKTKITVTCESVSESFELIVKKVQKTEIEVKELDLDEQNNNTKLEKEKVLTIRGEDYIIYLNGKDIVNFENELETELLFLDEKYLYLYNKEKEKYQQIQSKDVSLLCVDTTGKYLVTNKKQSGIQINMVFVVEGCVALLIGSSVYMGVKKRYWFW